VHVVDHNRERVETAGPTSAPQSLVPSTSRSCSIPQEAQIITHIGTVAVYVSDPDEALRFWTEQVGFELRSDRPMNESTRWLEVAPPGADSALVLYPKALMDDWKARKPSVVFVVDDIEETCDRLARKGVTFSQGLVDMAWGKFAAFVDTEGNEFGLRT